MPKYSVPAGSDIDMLGEECSEIIKEIFKIKRFGMLGAPEWLAAGNKSPRQMMLEELGGLLAIVERLLSSGGVSWHELHEAKDRKHARLGELFGLKEPAWQFVMLAE